MFNIINQSYLIYAKKISDVGDEIILTSNKLTNEVKFKNVEELKKDMASFNEAINEYKKHKIDSSNIIPPEIVKAEHNELINSLQKFIDGTELISKSIDIEGLRANEPMIKHGMDLQKQAEQETAVIIQQIINKLK